MVAIVMAAWVGQAAAEEAEVVGARAEAGLQGDPNIDRAWLSPTAATQPGGTWSFNDWELVLVGLTYGITDNVQLSVALLPPFVQDQPFVGYASLKVGLLSAGRVRLAGSVTMGVGHIDSETHGAGVAGGELSFCTDGPCSSILSAFVLAGFAIGDSQDAVPVYYGASLIQRLSDHVKLVLELDSGGWLGGVDNSGFANAALLDYGVRFFTHAIAVDVGLVRPFLFYKDNDNPFLLGYPMVTFSYRWGG
jgi:hypothetical protein